MAFNYRAVLLGIFFTVIIFGSSIFFKVSADLLIPDQEDLHYLAAWMATRRSIIFYVIAVRKSKSTMFLILQELIYSQGNNQFYVQYCYGVHGLMESPKKKKEWL